MQSPSRSPWASSSTSRTAQSKASAAVGYSASNAAFNSSYERCRDVPSNDPDQCFQRARLASDLVTRYPLLSANGAVVALVPVALGWLIAYALVYLVRWIRAGFKPRSS